MVGLGFLCKTGLALTPLGVAATLWGLSLLRFCPGPKLGTVVAMMAAAGIVAAPWSLYSAQRWPELHDLESRVTRAHLFHDPTVDVGPWRRPLDAVINEVNRTSFQPLPTVLPLLAFCWLLVRAVRKREMETVGLALWVGATWLVLSLGTVKVPAIAWGAVPAVLAAMAIAGSDLRRHPVLAALLLAGLATPLAMEHLPVLTRMREALPPSWAQTRTLPGLAEGLVLSICAAVLTAIVFRLARRPEWMTVGLGGVASGVLAWHLAITLPVEKARYEDEHLEELYDSHTREVGLAVAKRTPKRSVLFAALDMDPPLTFESLSLMFWSGRMAYRQAPDVALAHDRGYHPYLVSPVAESYAPVPGVPPQAALRAYDLDAPLPQPAPLPDGITPLSVRQGNLEVLGFAAGKVGPDRDRYAFYVRAVGPPQPLRVTFHGPDGIVERVLDPGDSLRRPHTLMGAAWFILPAVGPRLANVKHLEFGAVGQRVAVSPPAP
ncbi:dolichyl-phosphate-mannose--protein mannosyltransferase [Corallococcus carmarthensis]|uniref:Dolichyl-phosphate-mannose--protein mannosyltransferase n=1 Tax=Corallococcus carmarthensis TaxID=2316728 RepID=A0A3A8JLV3_9BACT|nr:dolichyl-phosphate-mannose--protein mannosyltransferase [Corallococcus carmarthensis]